MKRKGPSLRFSETKRTVPPFQSFTDSGYLLVPKDSQGALETFILKAFSEKNENRKQVADQVKAFIQHFSSDVYLKSRREKIKAELGVSLSIFNPDKVFTTMDELLKSVDWHSFDIVNDHFKILCEI